MSEKPIQNPESVPFLVFEDTVVRLERTIKRLWILSLIQFTALVGSTVAWIICKR